MTPTLPPEHYAPYREWIANWERELQLYEISDTTRRVAIHTIRRALEVIHQCERNGTISYRTQHMDRPEAFHLMADSEPHPQPRTVEHTIEEVMEQLRCVGLEIQRTCAMRGPQHPGDNAVARPALFPEERNHFTDALAYGMLAIGHLFPRAALNHQLHEAARATDQAANPYGPIEGCPCTGCSTSRAQGQPPRISQARQRPSPQSQLLRQFEELQAEPSRGSYWQIMQQAGEAQHALREYSVENPPPWRVLRELIEARDLAPVVVRLILSRFGMPDDTTMTGRFEPSTQLREEHTDEELADTMGSDTDDGISMGEAELWFREQRE